MNIIVLSVVKVTSLNISVLCFVDVSVGDVYSEERMSPEKAMVNADHNMFASELLKDRLIYNRRVDKCDNLIGD